MADNQLAAAPSRNFVWVGGLLLGLGLWVVNHLFLLAAFVRKDPGYEPLLAVRGQDTAQYFSWIRTLADRWSIPDYFAPWVTEAAHRVPLMWLIAQLNRPLGLPPEQIYVLCHIVLYALTGVAFAAFLRFFSRSRRDAVLSFLLMLCILPTRSFLLIPVLLFRAEHWRWSASFDSFAGGAMSDGFLQGISSSITITLGTMGVLVGLLLIGRYLESRSRRDLWTAALVNGLFTWRHPFEFAAILGAGGVAILYAYRGLTAAVVRDGVILVLPSVAAVLFYAAGITSPWLAVGSDLNRFEQPFTLFRLSLLGVPLLAITAATGLVGWRARRPDSKDVLLGVFLLTSFVVFFLPFMPWPRLSGLCYVAGLVGIHLWDDVLEPLLPKGPLRKLALAGAAGLLLLALIAHGYFRYASFGLGLRATTAPDAVSAVASVDERAIHAWLAKQPGVDRQLVLAPHAYAPWFTTIPMHSFGSHFLFSLTYPTQRELADRFFDAALPAGEAGALLARYGVHWVLLPEGSPALPYVKAAGGEQRLRTPTLVLYEIAGAVMRPFPKLTKAAPGRYEWLESR